MEGLAVSWCQKEYSSRKQVRTAAPALMLSGTEQTQRTNGLNRKRDTCRFPQMYPRQENAMQCDDGYPGKPLCARGREGNDTHPLASACDGFSDCGVFVCVTWLLVVWCSPLSSFLRRPAVLPSLSFFQILCGTPKLRPGTARTGHPNEEGSRTIASALQLY